jgi:hypothetical protein
MNFGDFPHHPGVVAAYFYILQIVLPYCFFSPAAGRGAASLIKKET